ncbi:MAG: sugar phosphate isomerase/epimerase family protein [Candidatus Promineifilaceae bacterium]
MKIGVNTWVWTSPLTTDEVQKLVPKVAKMGFDWIEFPLEDIGGFDYKATNTLLNDHGLGVSTCVAMGPDRDLIHEDPEVRANGMAYVRDSIDATKALGATNVVGPIYSAVGRTWQSTPEERAENLDLLVENLKELAAYAGERGVLLGVEPLNRFETSFINLAAQVIEVVDRVDHPSCQIMLDTFHMNIEEKSAGDAIRAAGPHLIHLHACENDRGAPGSGNVTWGEIGQALKDINYDGPVVIESFTAKVKTIARAAAIWRPLADSQDALAEDGLAFLRKLVG